MPKLTIRAIRHGRKATLIKEILRFKIYESYKINNIILTKFRYNYDISFNMDMVKYPQWWLSIFTNDVMHCTVGQTQE